MARLAFVLDSRPLPFASSYAPHLLYRPIVAIVWTLLLVILAVLGFHPSTGSYLPAHSDKVLHFFGFGLATIVFFWIWDVHQGCQAQIYICRHFARLLTSLVCFGAAIISEFVQALLPYKQFQLGDIVANILGVGSGLWIAEDLANRRRQRQEIDRLYLPLDVEAEELFVMDDDASDDGLSRPRQ